MYNRILKQFLENINNIICLFFESAVFVADFVAFLQLTFGKTIDNRI